jgi:HAD superfamily hydrolase (TIGR01509 family)
MMGMSSREWSRYMRDVIGLAETPEEINAEVVRRLLERYETELPLIDGAVDVVERLRGEFRLAVASSSNRPVIDAVLRATGLEAAFEVTVSSEEVERGKPAPDVYLEAARRLGLDPSSCAAVEDSGNGITAARTAGMRVLAIPNRRYPPASDALARADAVLESLADLTARVVRGGEGPSGPPSSSPRRA